MEERTLFRAAEYGGSGVEALLAALAYADALREAGYSGVAAGTIRRGPEKGSSYVVYDIAPYLLRQEDSGIIVAQRVG